MGKRHTAKLAWETAWRWNNTKMGSCVAALVGASMTAVFVGSSILSRLFLAAGGAIIGIFIFIGIMWLVNSIIISYRQRRDTKEALTKIRQYIATGKPIPGEEANRLSQSLDLSNLPISYTKTCKIDTILVWLGQSNVSYIDVADKEIVKVNFAIVGHKYTPDTAKIGLEEFVIRTVGFADKNSIFKLFCENQELGSVSILRNYKGEFKCQNRSTTVIVNSSLNEVPVVVRKIVRNKVIWEKILKIRLDLPVGETVTYKL